MVKCLVLDSMQKKCEASLETICHKKPMLSWVSMWKRDKPYCRLMQNVLSIVVCCVP